MRKPRERVTLDDVWAGLSEFTGSRVTVVTLNGDRLTYANGALVRIVRGIWLQGL